MTYCPLYISKIPVLYPPAVCRMSFKDKVQARLKAQNTQGMKTLFTNIAIGRPLEILKEKSQGKKLLGGSCNICNINMAHGLCKHICKV
ncbi:MAG: hypothetical protein C4B58_09195 [Deltaproteobacteria bacterium]|nr:MAG: hypothetical protein C4B58_09195 [Deltaproteobacteria bacterium]